MQKGDSPPTTLGLKQKLKELGGIQNFVVAPLGRGYFHVFLYNMVDQSSVLSIGPLHLKPGVFHISRRRKDFNPISKKTNQCQVWVRIYDLPSTHEVSKTRKFV